MKKTIFFLVFLLFSFSVSAASDICKIWVMAPDVTSSVCNDSYVDKIELINIQPQLLVWDTEGSSAICDFQGDTQNSKLVVACKQGYTRTFSRCLYASDVAYGAEIECVEESDIPILQGIFTAPEFPGVMIVGLIIGIFVATFYLIKKNK